MKNNLYNKKYTYIQIHVYYQGLCVWRIYVDAQNTRHGGTPNPNTSIALSNLKVMIKYDLFSIQIRIRRNQEKKDKLNPKNHF